MKRVPNLAQLTIILAASYGVVCLAGRLREQPRRLLQGKDSTCLGGIGEIEWLSVNGDILMNREVIHISGVTWYGTETKDRSVGGLEAYTPNSVFKFLANENINSVRIPVSLEFALSHGEENIEMQANESPDLIRKLSAWRILDEVIDSASRNGILVLLVMDRLSEMSDASQGLWYCDSKSSCEFTEEDFFLGWERLLGRYSHYWNLYGVDIYSPGSAGEGTWGSNDIYTDYKKFYDRAIRFMVSRMPTYNGLFFIQSPRESFDNIKINPMDTGFLSINNRIVCSPVFDMSSDALSLDKLSLDFGDLEIYTISAAVIGKWGGAVDSDKEVSYLQLLAQVLSNACIADNYWISLNPTPNNEGIMNSGWTTFSKSKFELIRALQPYPSKFEFNENLNQVCVHYGRHGVSSCEKDINVPEFERINVDIQTEVYTLGPANNGNSSRTTTDTSHRQKNVKGGKYTKQCNGCGGFLSVFDTSEYFMETMEGNQRYVQVDFEVYNVGPDTACHPIVHVPGLEILLQDPNAQLYQCEIAIDVDTVTFPKFIKQLDAGQDFDGGFIVQMDSGFPVIELISMGFNECS